MALLSDLNGFCDWLRAQLSGQVAIGKPDNTVSSVYIWPWRIAVDSPTKNLPPPHKPREASVIAPSIYHVHFLLLATPTDSPAGLANLEIAQQAIHGNPILDAAGHRVQVIEETISVRDLAAIFMAAKLELTDRNGNVITITERILRSWAESKEPMLQRSFIEYAFGKPPDKIETNLAPKTTLRLYFAHEEPGWKRPDGLIIAVNGEGTRRPLLP